MSSALYQYKYGLSNSPFSASVVVSASGGMSTKTPTRAIVSSSGRTSLPMKVVMLEPRLSTPPL